MFLDTLPIAAIISNNVGDGNGNSKKEINDGALKKNELFVA